MTTSSQQLDKKSKPRFSFLGGSLARTLIIGLLVLSLLPVIIVGTATLIRSSSMLHDFSATQIENAARSASDDLALIATSNQQYIDNILINPVLKQLIDDLIANPTSSTNHYLVTFNITDYIRRITATDQNRVLAVHIVDNNGYALSSTDTTLDRTSIGDLSGIRESLRTNKTIPAFNQAPLFTDKLVFLTSRPLTDANGTITAHIILVSESSTPVSTLTNLNLLYPSTNAFLLTSNYILLGLNPDQGNLQSLETTADRNYYLLSMLSQPGGALSDYTSIDNTPVMAYAIPIPDLPISIVIEVPTTSIFQQVNSVFASSLIILLVTILFISGIVYIGSSWIITPLVDLEKIAKDFAEGNLTVRAKVDRRDEIGSLAASFNTMGERLSSLYQSMEDKVKDQTQQFRVATEIGQLATSSAHRDEIFRRTVNLIVERFQYVFSSIFTIDESGNFIYLQESCYLQVNGEPSETYAAEEKELKDAVDTRSTDDSEVYRDRVEEVRGMKNTLARGFRIPVNANNIIARAAQKSETQVISNTKSDTSETNELLVPEAGSEIALPIQVGNDLIGILEIQSPNENAFDSDTVHILETLANQIANGLHNIRLFETTQLNLEEIDLLYRASRQITKAINEDEVIETFITTFEKTNYVCGLFSVEEDHLRIIDITDPRNPGVKSAQGISLPLLKVVTRLTAEHQVIIENLSNPSEFDNILSFFNRRGCHSAAILTINSDKGLEKIIVISSRDSTPITQAVLQPFSSLIEVAESTLRSFKLLSVLEKRVFELQTLEKISKSISAIADLQDLYSLLHREINEAIGKDIGFMIALYDAKNNMVEIPYIYDRTDTVSSIESFPLGEGLTSYVINNQKPLLLVKDTEKKAAELGAKNIGKPAKSWLGVPLVVAGTVLGILTLQDTEQEERFNENDLSMLVTLAPTVATTIRNLQLLADMKQALQAYDQERFLLNTLMENIPDKVFFKDSQSNYIRASHSYTDFYGIEDPLEIIGKTDFQFKSQESAAETYQGEQEILSQRSPVLGKVNESTGKDGKPAWSLDSLIPIVGKSDEIYGLLGIQRDITSMQEAQKLAEQRSQQLITAAEIARETTGTLDVKEVLSKAVNLVRERFGFYHSSIFLVDSVGEYAVLSESTGDVGQQMKEAGHRLAIGSRSIVGQASLQRIPMVIHDTTIDPNYYPNPLLPDTRAELAIPLTVGERLLGILDVQSTISNSFQPDDINILHILADLLAIAVLNSNLFSKTKEQITEHRLIQQIILSASVTPSVEDALENTIKKLIESRITPKAGIFIIDPNGYLKPIASSGYAATTDISILQILPGEGLIGQTASQRTPIRIEDTRDMDIRYSPLDTSTQSAIAVPILYADKLWGILEVESDIAHTFDEDDQEIITTLGSSLGAILANAQLVIEIRQQVERQRLLFEITSKIRRSTDMETILHTFTREVSNVLKARKAQVRITGSRSDQLPLHSEDGETDNNNNGKESA
jgi:PAS domain S-box-containing protein